jgi:hypothetical protein
LIEMGKWVYYASMSTVKKLKNLDLDERGRITLPKVVESLKKSAKDFKSGKLHEMPSEWTE